MGTSRVPKNCGVRYGFFTFINLIHKKIAGLRLKILNLLSLLSVSFEVDCYLENSDRVKKS